jgi:hypothetical protein
MEKKEQEKEGTGPRRKQVREEITVSKELFCNYKSGCVKHGYGRLALIKRGAG